MEIDDEDIGKVFMMPTAAERRAEMAEEEGQVAEETGPDQRTVPDFYGEIDKELYGDTYNHETGLFDHQEGHTMLTEIKKSYDLHRAKYGDNHRNTLFQLNVYARELMESGNPQEAEPLFKECLEKRRELFGDEDEDSLISLVNYGAVLYNLGDAQEAREHFEQALESRLKLFGENNEGIEPIRQWIDRAITGEEPDEIGTYHFDPEDPKGLKKKEQQEKVEEVED
jgi:tetratricopeptide (TPR) repeat protein